MEELYSVTKLKDGIWHVNEGGLDSMYVIRGSRRGLIVDTGTGAGDFKALAESLLGNGGTMQKDGRALHVPYDVVLTHGHVDHAGGAAQFEKVYIDSADRRMAEKVSAAQREAYIRRMNRAGASAVRPEYIAEAQKNEKSPQFAELGKDSCFRLGDRNIYVLKCPGHTAGSLCLMDREDKVLFSGDNLNDMELICAPGADRREILRRWYECAADIVGELSEEWICCGGHSVFSVREAEEIAACGKKALDGEIKEEWMRVHIFEGAFVRYKKSLLTFSGELKETELN